jgi:predicted permease
MAQTGLLDSFLAAIQASLSVLLVIFYGGVAAHLKLLNGASTKAISKICVRMFLPALLVVHIGSQLHSGSADRYLIIFVWAIICHLISFVIGIMAHFWLGMPDWTTVALMFNNTTSYPLLLIGALDETGILRALIVTDESTRAMVARAKSYFLVFATVSSCLTFAVGPRLIDTEHAPEADNSKEEADDSDGPFDATEQQYDDQADGNGDERTALLGSPASHSPRGGPDERRSTTTFASAINYAENTFFPSTRRLSVAAKQALPSTRRASLAIPQNRRPSIVPKRQWYKLGPRAKWWLLFISDFFNAPLLGAIIGAVIGLIPVLHRAFFNDTSEGGVFTAWLTASLKSIGELFVPLPVVVAGVSLYTAMKEARNTSSDTSAADRPKKMPWLTVAFIMVIRFVIWPAGSIYLVYVVAKEGTILGSDPMLWFAMMLMVSFSRSRVYFHLSPRFSHVI